MENCMKLVHKLRKVTVAYEAQVLAKIFEE